MHVPNPTRYKSEKLAATLEDKKFYVVHYMNLNLYLKLGMKLDRIHRVLAFRQKAFLKPYLDYCMQKRINSKTEFEKMLWKLFSNSVFGKFIEQKRKHIKVDMVNTERKLMNAARNPRLDAFKIIHENFALCFSKPLTVKLDRAYPVGFTILERSKWFMVDAYYNKIKPAFQDKACASLVYTDTGMSFYNCYLCLKLVLLK